MTKKIKTLEEFGKAVTKNRAAAFYFTTPDCTVCKILRPKLEELITEEFSEIKFYKVDCSEAPDVSGQNNIFTVPTVLFFFEEKEYIRKARNMSIHELRDEIKRPYFMIFGK